MNDAHPLTAFRKSHNPKMSQDALADLIGVARLTVLRWENGRRKIDPKLLSSVSQKTGIPQSDLRPDLAELFAPLTADEAAS